MLDKFGDAVSTNPWISLILLVVPGVIQWFVGGRPNGIAGLFAAILASFKPQPTPDPSPVNPVDPLPNPSPAPLLTNLVEILRSLAALKAKATDAEKAKIVEAEAAIKETIGPLAIECCSKPQEGINAT